jgi:hypothetical protein
VAAWARVRQVFVAGMPPVVAAAVLVGGLAGCGHDRNETSTSSVANTPQGAQPPAAPPPSAQAEPSPDPSGGSPANGSAGPASGSGGPAASGTADGSGTTQPDDTDSGEPASPAVAASPVFVGEPCAPSQDTAPQLAINGLLLYCVPQGGTQSPTGLGTWSDSPPKQQPTGPAPGAECSTSDVGQVQQDPSGRPVACLREPNGELRWADIS